MNISEVFIRRPIATSLLMAGIALFGVVAYRGLAVSDLPSVDFPTIQVQAGLPGADPTTMASAVATPLERQFTSIAGLDSMTSTSSTGNTQISLQFDLDRDIDGAAVDVQTAISEATPLLPPGLPAPPSFKKANPADQPVMYLALTSATLPLWAIDEYAETLVAQRLSMVSGVAQVQVWGSAKYAVRVQVDPDKLNAKQLGLNEIDSALNGWNVNTPVGTLYGAHTAYNIQANGQLMHAEDYRPLVVAWRNGAPIRLGEVANVIDSIENDKNASWANTSKGAERAVQLGIMRQAGSNTIKICDEIKRVLPSLQSHLPPSVTLKVRGDRSNNIRQAFHDIQFTMAITLGLVIAVIFLFLRNASATLIPSMALPFSILGTFAVMYLLNYSLDNISMMALILCIGFVVDDAIVMLENIVRHMEKGETAFQAALARIARDRIHHRIDDHFARRGVYSGAVHGRHHRTPVQRIRRHALHRDLHLRPGIHHADAHAVQPVLKRSAPAAAIAIQPRHGGLFNSMLNRLQTQPARGSETPLRDGDGILHPDWRTIYLFGAVSKGFIPDEDNDSMMVTLEAAQGTSYYKMVDYVQQVSTIMRHDPNIDSFMCAGRHHQHAPLLDAVEAAQNAGINADASDRRDAAQALEIPGRHACFWSLRPACASEGIKPSPLTISLCKAPTPTSCTNKRRAASRDRKVARLDRRHHGLAGQESASEPGHRSRSRGRARPGRAIRSNRRCTALSARAGRPPFMRPPINTRCCWKLRPNTRNSRTICPSFISKLPGGPTDPTENFASI